MTKYKISITASSMHNDDFIESIVNEYEVKARSRESAILKTIDKFLKIKVKHITLIEESKKEFTAFFNSYDLYGIEIK